MFMVGDKDLIKVAEIFQGEASRTQIINRHGMGAHHLAGARVGRIADTEIVGGGRIDGNVIPACRVEQCAGDTFRHWRTANVGRADHQSFHESSESWVKCGGIGA